MAKINQIGLNNMEHLLYNLILSDKTFVVPISSFLSPWFEKWAIIKDVNWHRSMGNLSVDLKKLSSLIILTEITNSNEIHKKAKCYNQFYYAFNKRDGKNEYHSFWLEAPKCTSLLQTAEQKVK